MKDHKLTQELLNDLKKYIAEKDVLHDVDAEISEDKMIEYILVGIQSSKDIQSGLYANVEKQGGFIRSLKNKVIGKIGNVARNVVELPFMRQQKFNDSVYLLLEYLLKENLALKEKLTKDGK
jgi:hypothetical protein